MVTSAAPLDPMCALDLAKEDRTRLGRVSIADNSRRTRTEYVFSSICSY